MIVLYVYKPGSPRLASLFLDSQGVLDLKRPTKCLYSQTRCLQPKKLLRRIFLGCNLLYPMDPHTEPEVR